MSAFVDELHWRGMVYASTEGAAEHLAEGRRTAYIGFDPTAASLHVGSLLPIMGLVHFQRAGHVPLGLVGGGTGLIGDPSGKTAERQLLTKEQAAENAEGIRRQLEHFLDFEVKSNPARMADNLDWLGGLPLVDFLRDVGKRLSAEELTLKLTDAAVDFLVKNGFDQSYGARPLKRAIQRFIEDPLSEKILLAEFSKGDEIDVDVAAGGDKLDFRALANIPKA